MLCSIIIFGSSLQFLLNFFCYAICQLLPAHGKADKRKCVNFLVHIEISFSALISPISSYLFHGRLIQRVWQRPGPHSMLVPPCYVILPCYVPTECTSWSSLWQHAPHFLQSPPCPTPHCTMSSCPYSFTCSPPCYSDRLCHTPPCPPVHPIDTSCHPNPCPPSYQCFDDTPHQYRVYCKCR